MGETPPLVVDGFPLDTAAHAVGMSSSRWSAPSRRGANVPVPARHGELWVPGKTYNAGELALSIHVQGARDDGTVPPDELAQTQANIDKLLRIFGRTAGLLRLSQQQADGTTRICDAECVAAIDITRSSAALPYAMMAVELRVPGAFWRDDSNTTWSSPAGIRDEQVLSLSPFHASTAPLDELVYVLHGPADSPQLRGYDVGAYVAYQGSLDEGEDWRVNAATWSSVVGTGIGFDGDGTSVITQTTHGGSARFLELAPSAPPGIIVSGGNLGAATQLEVKGRNKYLLG